MKKRPQHLRLVKSAEDPELRAAEQLFRSLVETRTELRKPPNAARPRRQTFFMMEHDLLTALGRALNYPALVLISELDRLVFTSRHNPVSLTNERLKRLGLVRQNKMRALRRLQKVGVVELESQSRGAVRVTLNNPSRKAPASSD